MVDGPGRRPQPPRLGASTRWSRSSRWRSASLALHDTWHRARQLAPRSSTSSSGVASLGALWDRRRHPVGVAAFVIPASARLGPRRRRRRSSSSSTRRSAATAAHARLDRARLGRRLGRLSRSLYARRRRLPRRRRLIGIAAVRLRRRLGALRARPPRPGRLSCTSGRRGWRRRGGCGPTRRGRRSASGSPARCTTCSPTGSRCSACTPGRSNTGPTRRPPRSQRPRAWSASRRAAALEELRDVIGVLREGTESEARPPQPTLADLPALIEESRAAGMRIEAELDLPTRTRRARRLGRTAYRIVQEGLTNARKHAPGTLVAVRGHGGRRRRSRSRSATGRRSAPVAAPGAAGRGQRPDRPRRAGRAGRRRAAPRVAADGDFVLAATPALGAAAPDDPGDAGRRRPAGPLRPADAARRRRRRSRSSPRPTTATRCSPRSTATAPTSS